MKKFNFMQTTLTCCAVGNAVWLSAYWVFATEFANYWRCVMSFSAGLKAVFTGGFFLAQLKI